MLDSKTLLLQLPTGTIRLWDLNEELVNDYMDKSLADNIRDNLRLYYTRLDITGDRSGIARLRENMVDLIWLLAYDEFEDNESFISLAKCTEPDLVQSVHGCLIYQVENKW
jgi:hypothetical protein